MTRTWLSDAQYDYLIQFLPAERGGREGRPYSQSHRITLEAILYKARTGCQWVDLPEKFGKWNTIYRRLNRWNREFHFEEVLQSLLSELDLDTVSVDGTFIKVHQSAHGARLPDPSWGLTSKEVQAIGWTKGGYTSLITAATDKQGRFVDFNVYPGNTHESRLLPPLIGDLPIGNVLADRGYDSKANRRYLTDRGIEPCIPPRKMKNRKVIPYYNKHLYKARHLVENAFADLKHWRDIALRSCKEGWMFYGLLCLAMFVVNTRTTRRSYSLYDPPDPALGREGLLLDAPAAA